MDMKEKSSKESEFQADRHEAANNKTKSDSSLATKAQISNPEKFMTANSKGADLATEVTVYNDNLSLVKERRELELKIGINMVEYTNVASLIDPTSVILRI